MKKLSLQLTQGLLEQDKKSLEEAANSNEALLNQIKTVLSKILDESIEKQRALKSYELASWPYMQADQVGYQRALSEIITLITLRE